MDLVFALWLTIITVFLWLNFKSDIRMFKDIKETFEASLKLNRHLRVRVDKLERR